MKSLLKFLIVVTGSYCLGHIFFDYSELKIVTNVIQTLFFLFAFIYFTVYRKEN
ncbi:hypothetical protein N1I87_08420 [Bacillus sp. FSL W8-0102]|uniref:hypothetical protein n=1 Tax=Bacillus sp. FSL W8-0102 TaxID=2978205 RepID=UPI0030F615C4